MALEHSQGAYAARIARARARDFLKSLGIPNAELSILITTDRRIRALNARWRGKDAPTDVLSFPLEEPGHLGDLVISLDTARRQARAGGWSLARELGRLVAHGLLHLVGLDHERPADARRMARAEERLLGRAGMVGESLASLPRLAVKWREMRERRRAPVRAK